MVRIYTKKSEQGKRRHLRKNMPKAEVLLWLLKDPLFNLPLSKGETGLKVPSLARRGFRGGLK